jgi:hypothetical protein
VLVDAVLFATALSRALGEAAADDVDDESESSADASQGGATIAPPMPSAMASAPTRPMYVEASAESMAAFRGCVISNILGTHVTGN